jgi:hypothetical protein
MTDQGSASHLPGDEERASGADPESPNPFSRESSGLNAGDRPHPSGDPSSPAADPYGYPPAPGAGTDEGTGYPTYGQPDPGRQDGPDQGYGQNRYPSGPPGPDPSQPYVSPSTQPYVPPGPDPYADPRPQYDLQAGSYGPSPYATGPGQGYEVSPYQGTYGGYAAYGATPVQHPQVVAALVTGLLGVLMCPFVGIAAIVLGSKARREIDSDPQRYTGRAMATAGFVLGIIGTVLTVLLVLGIVGIVGLASQ